VTLTNKICVLDQHTYKCDTRKEMFIRTEIFTDKALTFYDY